MTADAALPLLSSTANAALTLIRCFADAALSVPASECILQGNAWASHNRHYLIAEGPQSTLRLRLPHRRATVSKHWLDVTILQQDF